MFTKFETFVLRSDGASIPLDSENKDYREYLEWVEAGNQPALPAAPSFQERTAHLLTAVDAHMNEAARAKGYDSIITAALRAALPASPFHSEGLAFGTWMDQVYSTCYQLLAKVKAGEIEEPDEAQLLAMLPPGPVFGN